MNSNIRFQEENPKKPENEKALPLENYAVRVEKVKRAQAKKDLISKAGAYLLLSVGAVTMIAPFLWMVATSLKEPGQIFSFQKNWWEEWLPTTFVWRNYVQAWQVVPFAKFYLNSIFVTTCVTFGQVTTSAMAAYSFARLKFPGRDRIFFGYLATMMVPGAVTMIPVFILLRQFGWIDTYKALILPGIFTAYGTFMLAKSHNQPQ